MSSDSDWLTMRNRAQFVQKVRNLLETGKVLLIETPGAKHPNLWFEGAVMRRLEGIPVLLVEFSSFCLSVPICYEWDGASPQVPTDGEPVLRVHFAFTPTSMVLEYFYPNTGKLHQRYTLHVSS
jgi:hypothetical protein